MDSRITTATENELIRGCLYRERKAQKQLYDLFAPLMYPVCCRYLKNRADAEDVLVMAFTKAFQKIEQFRHEGSFSGWLKRIVINESLCYLRKQQTLVVIRDLDDDAFNLGTVQNDQDLDTKDLMHMICQLPPGYRTVFNMYAIDGYSHKEIALQLGITENTSKSQLSRARTLLQRFIVNSQSIKYPNQHDLTA